MNGEMYQACSIVAAAKKALGDKQGIKYVPLKYENSIVFHFLPKKKLFGKSTFIAYNVEQWYEKCIEIGLDDIKFLTPIENPNRAILGFSNSIPNSLVCFYKNKKVTYFTSRWEFDSILNAWNIIYTEYMWKNAPQEKPQFKDNTESMKHILGDIAEFAKRIECDGFSKIFNNAKEILEKAIVSEQSNHLPLPLKHRCLFQAASKADVFGAMGSWNDSPPCIAHEMGLEQEYDELSTKLLLELRKAVLFAVNEW